jgi:hypothetical protein
VEDQGRRIDPVGGAPPRGIAKGRGDEAPAGQGHVRTVDEENEREGEPLAPPVPEPTQAAR